MDDFKWIRINVTPEEVGQIIRIKEQIIPTRTFLQMQGKHQETKTCKLCEEHPEGSLHWMSACPYLAGSEYLRRHNQALKVFYVAVAKKIGPINQKIAWFNAHISPVID